MEGGGQVVVQRRGEKYYAYVGHMEKVGTSTIECTNPEKPVVLTTIPIPPNTHSHKVRVSNNLMFVNNETLDAEGNCEAGLRIFDISNPVHPVEISFFKTGGKGVHRFWIDEEEELAYLATGVEGYLHAIFMILDIADPKKPKEISRWWIPGQWERGGENPSWVMNKEKFTAHGPPIPVGDRVYLGYWDAGFVILDISNKCQPRLVSRGDYSPPYGGCTHTVLPIVREIMGRRWIIVTDEATAMTNKHQEGKKLVWFVDVTEETNPVPVATFQVYGDEFIEANGRFGPHNLYEDVNAKDNLIYITYFNAGVRIVDISNPYRPEEVGYYVPAIRNNQEPIQTNDVYVDDRELIYIIDRLNGGLDILEYVG